jgi:cytochrome c oxidase assembly factor CtaG
MDRWGGALVLAHARIGGLGVEGTVALMVAGGATVAYRAALRRAGSRQPRSGSGRLLAFAAAVLTLGPALAGPVERLAHHSFAAHMAQHLLLGVLAPPLLLLGRPLEVFARLGPRRGQRMVARAYGRALRLGRGWRFLVPAALLAYTLTWWFWHVPLAYSAALSSPVIHATEHATLVLAALALWAPIVRPRRLPAWLSPLLLLGAAIQGGLLAALLTFAQRPWYGDLGYGALTPLEDQQLGGTMMWVLAGMVYLLAAATTFARWLRADEIVSDRLTLRPRSGDRPSQHASTPREARHVP